MSQPDMTVKDVAAAISASENVVRGLLAAGDLPGAYRLSGARGRWRIPASALDAFRERRATRDPWVRTRPRRRTGVAR